MIENHSTHRHRILNDHDQSFIVLWPKERIKSSSVSNQSFNVQTDRTSEHLMNLVSRYKPRPRGVGLHLVKLFSLGSLVELLQSRRKDEILLRGARESRCLGRSETPRRGNETRERVHRAKTEGRSDELISDP